MRKETVSAVTCAAHDLTNISKRFLNKTDIPGFQDQWKLIKQFLVSAEKFVIEKPKNKDSDVNLGRGYNDYIYDLEVDSNGKSWIAEIMFPKFDQKDDEEKIEIMKNIERYPTLHPIHEIRFRSTYTEVTNLLKNRPVIRAIIAMESWVQKKI